VRIITLTYNEQMQAIANKYWESGEPWPATSRQIAAWAVRHRLWAPHESSLISQCAEALAQAMREEYIKDPQGRTVRAKHAARVEQAVFWDDIRTAPREHMEVAFKQRRQMILGDCRQLKTDVDSFNQNRSETEPIQMSFDFTNDLLELAAIGR
jgi:hypothetical protein